MFAEEYSVSNTYHCLYKAGVLACWHYQLMWEFFDLWHTNNNHKNYLLRFNFLHEVSWILHITHLTYWESRPVQTQMEKIQVNAYKSNMKQNKTLQNKRNFKLKVLQKCNNKYISWGHTLTIHLIHQIQSFLSTLPLLNLKSMEISYL